MVFVYEIRILDPINLAHQFSVPLHAFRILLVRCSRNATEAVLSSVISCRIVMKSGGLDLQNYILVQSLCAMRLY